MTATTVRVQSLAELEAVFAALRRALADWRPVWVRVQGRLPKVQRAYFDARFYKGYQHSETTLEERRAGLGNPVREARRRRKLAGTFGTYYDKNRPGPRARPDHPYWEWTGSLRRATEVLTLLEAARAAIDTERSYQGRIRGLSDPVGTIIEEHTSAWDARAVEVEIERAIQDWVENVVAPAGAAAA